MPKQVSAPAYAGSLWTGKRSFIAAFLFFNFCINYMDRTNLSVAAPLISKQFEWDPAMMGWVFSAFLWTYILCLVPWGWITDRYGPRKVGTFSMALWSIGGMATGGTVGFGSMLASRLALGVGEAASFPFAGKVVRQWFSPSERGLATAIFNVGTLAGPAMSAPFVAWLVLETGWRASFVITGAIGLVWAVLWYKAYRAPAECSWLPEDERNYLVVQTDTPVAADAQQTPTKGALGLLLRRKTMWGQLVTQGCLNYNNYLFLFWLPTYLMKERHMDLMQASWFTALPYFIAVVLGILIGMLSDRILTPEAVKQGKRRTLMIVFILISSSVFLTNVISNQWVVVALISIALTCVSSALTLNIALCNDLVWDQSMAATALGVQLLGGNIFGLIAPILTGYIVKTTGSFDSAFFVAGGLLVLGALTSFTMTRQPLAFAEVQKAVAR